MKCACGRTAWYGQRCNDCREDAIAKVTFSTTDIARRNDVYPLPDHSEKRSDLPTVTQMFELSQAKEQQE